MNENLKVSFIQTELSWENPAINRKRFSDKITSLPETDLIVLPEMFSTGFSMNSEKLAEKTQGETVVWMQKMAAKKNAAITGSIIVCEGEKYFNRMFFVFPDGNFETYDKKHLFTFADEHESYSPGNKKLIVEYLGWKICPLICYDLRFPVWSRNVENYDLLIYVANWPKARTQAWDILLKARAIENISYVVGVNRVGKDGNELEYSGHSAVYDMLGTRISTSDFENEFSETIVLSKPTLDTTRRKFAFLNDGDKFEIQ
ncbi:MAG TPA: amidohydrolase [Flavobacteriaceae bacterium]|nr:amidohydrolase [Flavobacteriaceae bacterium]